MKHTFRSILSHAPDFFSYTLLIYLVLFLLENILPGFVSYTFDPNLLLIPVVILGIASSFAPEVRKAPAPVTRKDYIAVAFLVVLAGTIVYYKTRELGTTSIIISIVAALLVLLVSALLLFMPEENEAAAPPEDDFSIHQLKYMPPASIKRIQNRRWRVILIVTFLTGLMLAFMGTRYMRIQQGQTTKQTIQETRLTLGALAEGKLTRPDKTVLEATPLVLLNGGLGDEKVNTLAQELTSYHVTVEPRGEADRLDYEGGTLYFRPEDASVSAYLEAVLAPLYPSMDLLPLPADTAGIILVAGKQEGSQ